uniref:Uncharacterized protein n=1 Tax=Acrobeloides nanus TaxID=290746 RepID=A0A914E9P3_9BILA
MAQRFQKYKPIFLALNAKKSKWMLLSPGTKIPNITLAIDGAEIEKADTVDLDRKIVCFKEHVTRITKKCKKAIGALCGHLAPSLKSCTRPQLSL